MQANLIAGFMILAFIAAIRECSRYDVIPDLLEKRINKDLFYEDILNAPSVHQDQLVVLGGKVLSSIRMKDRTRIEVLQLPLTAQYIPRTDQESYSQGRFYAYDSGKEIHDPMTLSQGTPITLVGEVRGVENAQIAQAEQRIPALLIKDLTTWEVSEVRRWGAFPYPYYYGGYLYGARPYGFYYW